MSSEQYDAHPSLLRMRPFGTMLALLGVLAGFLLAITGNGFLPEAVALAGVNDAIAKYFGVGLFALSVFILFLWYVATRVDHLVVKDDEIVWTHGIFSRQYTEIGMGSVRTVRVTQSFFQRLMNAGDVSVYTAGDTPELVIRGLPDPNRIRDLVKTKTPQAA